MALNPGSSRRTASFTWRGQVDRTKRYVSSVQRLTTGVAVGVAVRVLVGGGVGHAWHAHNALPTAAISCATATRPVPLGSRAAQAVSGAPPPRRETIDSTTATRARQQAATGSGAGPTGEPMPSYGTIDPEYAGRLATCAPEQDGPILMVNFMRYRARADYGAGGGDGVSGREADDRYAPLDVLAAIGAEVVFFGDAEAGGAWDRVGIVCYPSRRAFMGMQSRPDFQARHVHKSAGMERTIVCGALVEVAPGGPLASGGVAFELVTDTAALRQPATARLRVEGTIIGDGRRFATLGVSWLGAQACEAAAGPERVVAVVPAPGLDRLASHLGARS